MAMYAGKSARVTIEMPDGRIQVGAGTISHITQEFSNPFYYDPLGPLARDQEPGFDRWSVEIEGPGHLMQCTREQAKENRSAIEWGCDFCGSVNPKKRTACSQCGGYRSFLYEV